MNTVLPEQEQKRWDIQNANAIKTHDPQMLHWIEQISKGLYEIAECLFAPLNSSQLENVPMSVDDHPQCLPIILKPGLLFTPSGASPGSAFWWYHILLFQALLLFLRKDRSTHFYKFKLSWQEWISFFLWRVLLGLFLYPVHFFSLCLFSALNWKLSASVKPK